MDTGQDEKINFLYSQNGSLYSNWEYDEIIALVAIAILAKLLNEGEGLNKMYSRIEEIKCRYKKRESGLFHKTVYLRGRPRKLFICGSPEGAYLIYY
ncbi:MAG: hypothetical protein SVK08_03775 [Halobacteriota archaeon]|nr:hypothetical protein [Halobacteriota archaeon]